MKHAAAAALAAFAALIPAAAMADDAGSAALATGDTRVAAAAIDDGTPGQTAAAPAPPPLAPPPLLAPPPAPLASPAPHAMPADVWRFPAPPQPAELSPLEQRRRLPNGSRGLLGHTALTVPQGTVDVSMRTLFPYAALATISVGVGPTTELSADLGGTIIDDSQAALVGGGVKQVLVRTDRVQLSVGGSIRRLHMPDGDGGINFAQAGGTLSACLDQPCSVLVSGGLSAIYTTEEDRLLPSLTVGISAGSRHTRVLGEAFVVEDVTVLVGGLRFGNVKYSGDLGLLAVLVDDTGILPFAGFGVRM